MGYISPDRKQINMLGYCMDDFVPKDAKCRFVVNLVSKLDLSSLYKRYSSQGNDAKDPSIMLAIWFLAYSEGIASTRKLEDFCCYDLRFIYISANLRPDHTTLSRFRKNHLDLMAEYFVQIVILAQQSGISDFKEINIDGTKIKASCSFKQSFKEDQLAKKIKSLRKDISDYMERCDLAEEGTDKDIDLETLRKEKERLEQQEQKLLERQEQLSERKKELKPEHRKNHQINIVEPEARLMPKGDGPCYNAQAAALSKHNFIVANDVVTEPNDQNQFSNMHQKTENNIGSGSERKYNSDAGYHSLKQLEYVEENEIDAVIADPTPKNRSNKSTPTCMETILSEDRKLERSDFTYHPEEDYYECPKGQKLEPSIKKGTSKSKTTRYKASNCQDCPLIALCLPDKQQTGNRQIHRDYREILAEKMEKKLETEDAKSRLIIRASTIEPVFGNIKQNLGFRRFSLRDLVQVKGEFNLMCIAHNLNILFSMVIQGALSFSTFAIYLNYYQQIIMSKTRFMIYIQLISRISNWYQQNANVNTKNENSILQQPGTRDNEFQDG
jgi:transposase